VGVLDAHFQVWLERQRTVLFSSFTGRDLGCVLAKSTHGKDGVRLRPVERNACWMVQAGWFRRDRLELQSGAIDEKRVSGNPQQIDGSTYCYSHQGSSIKNHVLKNLPVITP
jgi:hypothetical protein